MTRDEFIDRFIDELGSKMEEKIKEFESLSQREQNDAIMKSHKKMVEQIKNPGNFIEVTCDRSNNNDKDIAKGKIKVNLRVWPNLN